MSTYIQLTQAQRYQIKALLSIDTKKAAIARELGVDKSTIYRELKRNQGKRGYRPKQAHAKALIRRTEKSQRRIRATTWALVDEKLHEDWSPEQISGRLKKNGIFVSHECIYQYIYADKRVGGMLWKHLRCQKKCRKRVGGRDRRGKIPNRRSIEERPAIVDERTRLGDWETDLILGKDHQGVVLTLTERKSRFTLLRPLPSKHADLVSEAMIELLKWVISLSSITADNGKEFAGHQKISHSLDTDFYFAHPYASWERGTNENTNGLIRQYLPKSRSLKKVSAQEETRIMDRLNLRPRKCLDFRTPYEVFFGHQSVALTS
ncbi:MAG: IS30 family transposase [Anaerolineae bacterium]|nr:IS30 family transposase [Anaerolineae bacterium]